MSSLDEIDKQLIEKVKEIKGVSKISEEYRSEDWGDNLEKLNKERDALLAKRALFGPGAGSPEGDGDSSQGLIKEQDSSQGQEKEQDSSQGQEKGQESGEERSGKKRKTDHVTEAPSSGTSGEASLPADESQDIELPDGPSADTDEHIVVDDEDVFPVEHPGNNENEVTVGKLGRKYVVRVGPNNAGIYFIRFTEGKDHSEPDKRFAEVDKDGRGHTFKLRDLVSLMGVAFTSKEFDLDLIDPDLVKTGPSGRKYPTTYVWAKWKIDGKIEKSWETRTAIRRLYGNRKCESEPLIFEADRNIFETARRNLERYQEFTEGRRPGTSKSPTPAAYETIVGRRPGTSKSPAPAKYKKTTIRKEVTPASSTASDGEDIDSEASVQNEEDSLSEESVQDRRIAPKGRNARGKASGKARTKTSKKGSDPEKIDIVMKLLRELSTKDQKMIRYALKR